MSHRLGLVAQGAAQGVAWAVTTLTTAWSLTASINVGMISTAGVAIVGIIAFAAERISTVWVKIKRENAQAELDNRRSAAAAEMEAKRAALAAELEAKREVAAAELQAKKDSDAWYSQSVTKQIDDLKAQIKEAEDAAAADRETLLQRVNDANAKLHEERDRWNVAQAAHIEEALRLQLQLREANHEMRALKEEVKKVRAEYSALWSQYNALMKVQEDLPRRVAERLSGDDIASKGATTLDPGVDSPHA